MATGSGGSQNNRRSRAMAVRFVRRIPKNAVSGKCARMKTDVAIRKISLSAHIQTPPPAFLLKRVRTLADKLKRMNIPAPEADNTHVHLQTMLLRVRTALNECPADPQLTLRCLRGWLDVCVRYEEDKKRWKNDVSKADTAHHE
jgi:hypothetical protein